MWNNLKKKKKVMKRMPSRAWILTHKKGSHQLSLISEDELYSKDVTKGTEELTENCKSEH